MLAHREVRPPPVVGLVHGASLGDGVLGLFPSLGFAQGVKASPYEVATVHGVGVALFHSSVFHG
ncbi:UNVERIFIED_CONTAM: hypothetical protein Sradi_1499800 [Sesamum radiatum]|uniref:Uncharacterized protein n=1 Tax=Sesamum radiatum TaxID=300843 RepID=A0AAW2UB10_SESRA